MNNRFRFLIVFLIGAFFTVNGNAQSKSLLVALKPQATWPTGTIANVAPKASASANKLFKAYGVVRVERWLHSADASDVYNGVDFSRVYRLRVEKTQLLKAAKQDFGQLPEVLKADIEPLVKIAAPILPTIPDDPYYGRQWYLPRIMANYAWTLLPQAPQKGQQILIGIVDTGIDYLHPEMAEVLYVNPGEDLDGDGLVSDSDYNGIDDDGNGFVDDLTGWDFSYASDSVAGDNDIRPPNAGSNEILSHGTHVAGIAGAMNDNQVGISGIARGYKIIGTKHSLDDDYSHGYLYNAYDGILYCAKLGADVINCSWGGSGYSQLAQDLINMVRQNYGAIVVAAAGNDNTNNDYRHFYPSDLDGVVTVAALNGNDQKASFSNFGQVIDISAPGQGIYSTIHYYKGGYASWQGTSMASPVVAGALALEKFFFPDLTPDSLVARLLNAADNIDEKNKAYRGLLGSGRVNVYRAIAPAFLPNLEIVQDSLRFEDLNLNEQIDPGETVQFAVTLQNERGWRDAFDVSITARCNDSLAFFTDSTFWVGDLSAGQQRFSDFVFTLQIDTLHRYGAIEVSFIIRGKNAQGTDLKEVYNRTFNLSRFQKNFPVPAAGGSLPLTVFYDDSMQTKYIAFITINKELQMIDGQARQVQNFPVDLNTFHRAAPVAVDLQGDGRIELLTLGYKGELKVVAPDGNLVWTRDLNETIYGSFAVADLDYDDSREIVIGTMSRKLHVLDEQGDERNGFPVKLTSLVDRGPAIADLNNDGFKEIVIGTFDRKLYCFDLSKRDSTGAPVQLAGWPIDLTARVAFTPLIGTDLEKTRIFVITRDNRLLIFSPQGEEKKAIDLDAQVHLQPALGDVDNDGLIEIVFTINDQLIVASEEGIEQRVALNFVPEFSPLIAGQRIVLASKQGQIVVTDFKGNFAPYTPYDLEQSLSAQPVLTDLDNDGDYEFVSVGSEALIALDFDEPVHDETIWTSYLGGSSRTGYLKVKEIQTIVPKPQLKTVKDFRLTIAPNPFNSQVKIQLKLPQDRSTNQVQAVLFNIYGQKIKTLYRGSVKEGVLNLRWNGKNDQGRTVSSGLYFLKIKMGHWSLIRRLVMIK